MSRRKNKQNRQQPQQSPPPVPQQKVNLNEADDVVCMSCGNYTFVPVMLMKKISALDPANQTGQDGYVPLQVFACNACGFVNAEFLPKSTSIPDERQQQGTTGPQPDGTYTDTGEDTVPEEPSKESPIITSF